MSVLDAHSVKAGKIHEDVAHRNVLARRSLLQCRFAADEDIVRSVAVLGGWACRMYPRVSFSDILPSSRVRVAIIIQWKTF